CDTGDRRIDPLEDVVLRSTRFHLRIEQFLSRELVSAAFDRTHFLGLVLASAFASDLRIRTSDQRVETSSIDRYGDFLAGRGSKALSHIEFLRLPREQTFLDLFRELIRVGSSFICKRGQVPGKLVLAVAVRRCARETRNDDERTERSDRADHLTESRLFAPNSRCFGTRLR